MPPQKQGDLSATKPILWTRADMSARHGTSYRVGEVDLELEILKFGFRRSVLTPGWTALWYWRDFLTVRRKERADLKAFLSVGWEFHPGKDLDWRTLRGHYKGQPFE